MQLSIRERLLLPALYPHQDSRFNQVVARTIRELAGITPDEWDDAGIQYGEERGCVGYRVKNDFVREFFLGELELQFLKTRIEALDAHKLFTIELLSLADKIEQELRLCQKQG